MQSGYVAMKRKVPRYLFLTWDFGYIRMGNKGWAKMDIYSMLRTMKEKGASDLHIVPGTSPTLRIDGILVPLEERKLTAEESKPLIYSLMDDEKIREFEQNKELDFSWGLRGSESSPQTPDPGRFRVNAHFQRGSVAAAIRTIPDRISSLVELNLPSLLEKLALKEKGLILVTGPSGCGKTTTLAALVEIINEQRAAHIIVIEDPVEYMHSHKKGIVEQREVGEDTLSFASSLKYCLRQDPDVISIGEMRDLETIATAITAAETGHLILATLHTPDAPLAIDRIIDVFPPHQQYQIRMQLSTTLLAVIAQILLPRKDGAGRVPAVELLIANPAVSNLIRSKKTHQLYAVMQTGGRSGMRTMDQALKELVQKGLVSFETALSRARDPHYFRKSLG
jgi:twitching motility protein PilT